MQRQHWRMIVAGGLLAASAAALLLNPSAPFMLRCATGDGFSWVSTQPHDFEADFFGYRWRGNTSNYIDRQVEMYGAYELPVIFAMQDAMLAVAGDVPPVAIDVGANIGHHSLFLSRSASQVIAVEPYPPVRERMRALLDANGVTNVEIHPVGYSDQPGMLPFHEPTSANTGVGSFSTDRATGSQATRELPLVRGDDDLSGLPAAHLIKIDIEGFEKQALAGLTHTLSASRPAVMIELNVSGAAGFHNEQELRAALPPRYTFFRISTPLWLEWELPSSRIVCAPGRKNYLLTPYDMTFDHDGYNLLALPDEHRLALASHIR